MMHIDEQLLQKGPYTRSGQALPIITGIVWHWLGNAGTSTRANADWMDSIRDTGPRYASYHYIIDVDGSIMQLIPDDEVAWHAGPSDRTLPATRQLLGGLPNWRTLGVSFCHKTWTGELTDKQFASAVALGTELCERYRLDPMRRMLRHYDCTLKVCPRAWVDSPGDWDAFRRALNDEIFGGQKWQAF